MLILEGVSKTYTNGKTALDDVSFKVAPGEFLSIIGPSGAGKSTLLRCINRLVEPTAGKIWFHGEDLTSVSKKELRKKRRKIGMIFQHYNLVSRMTAVENVLHGCLGYKSTVAGVLGQYSEQEKIRAFSLLEQVGLSEFAYTRCDQLSGGQKQRVGIARALMQEPEIILCDEPIASLDPKSSKVVMEILCKTAKELQITCIVNLHQVEVAQQYSDRIIGINEGQVVFEGCTEELSLSWINRIYQSKELLV